MPELPEVECVRRSLRPVLVGSRVKRVEVRRAGVVRVDRGIQPDPPPGPLPASEEWEASILGAHDAALLSGMDITSIHRHGKQLALVGERQAGQTRNAGCVVVHLGMSGQLRWVDHASRNRHPPPPHTHIIWRFGAGELRFTDPRRFGGLWCYPSLDHARSARWDMLGPDALAATPARLHAALSRTRRPLKPALLDQHIVAGLGNIYVDELLFGAKLHPMTPADTVGRAQSAGLARRMRTLLQRAIDAGGSTLRDYVDGHGTTGGYQLAHRVYGRAGLPCRRRGCRGVLTGFTLAGRTTVCCPRCQGGHGA